MVSFILIQNAAFYLDQVHMYAYPAFYYCKHIVATVNTEMLEECRKPVAYILKTVFIFSGLEQPMPQVPTKLPPGKSQ